MKVKNPAICDQYFFTHMNPCYYCPLRDECQDDLQRAKTTKRNNEYRMNVREIEEKEEYYDEENV